MSRYIIPIDASNLPDLLKVAEEVSITQTPRLIKRNGETLAMLMPTGKTAAHRDKHDMWIHYRPEQVRTALQQSAGALQGVDREKLLSDLTMQRDQESPGRLL